MSMGRKRELGLDLDILMKVTNNLVSCSPEAAMALTNTFHAMHDYLRQRMAEAERGYNPEDFNKRLAHWMTVCEGIITSGGDVPVITSLPEKAKKYKERLEQVVSLVALADRGSAVEQATMSLAFAKCREFPLKESPVAVLPVVLDKEPPVAVVSVKESPTVWHSTETESTKRMQVFELEFLRGRT